MSLSSPIDDYMIKKQLVSTGIILALLTSNIVITHEFKQMSNKYEQELKEKDRILAFRQSFVREKQDKIDVLTEQVKSQENEIHILKQRLVDYKTRSESPSVNVSRGIQNNYKKIHMIATAYISRCYGCLGITKTGINVRNTTEYKGMKVIAVDPSVIPLRSVVKLYMKDGTFYAYAADTGGKIKGNHIDFLIDTHDEQKAFTFGVQDVVVQIIKEGEG